jgi:hypothetical protein
VRRGFAFAAMVAAHMRATAFIWSPLMTFCAALIPSILTSAGSRLARVRAATCQASQANSRCSRRSARRRARSARTTSRGVAVQYSDGGPT